MNTPDQDPIRESSDDFIDVAMDEPVTSDIPPNLESGKERIRPGRKGISIKLLFWLMLIGLFPTLLMLPLLWTLLDQWSQTLGEINQEMSQLKTHSDSFVQSLQVLQNEVNQSRQAQAQAAHDSLAAKSLEELASKIRPLVTEKKAEEITADASIKQLLVSIPSPFEDLAVLDPDSKTVLVAKSQGSSVPLEKVFPNLSSLLNSGKGSPTLSQIGWHWKSLRGSSYLLAYNLSAPASPTLASLGNLTPPEPSMNRLGLFNDYFSRWILFPAIGLPLLALLLAVGAFVWFRNRILYPLDRIGVGARLVLENHGSVTPELFQQSGLLAELAQSLERFATKLRQLHNLENDHSSLRGEIQSIQETLVRAAKGDLSQRARAEECAELALAANQLLDADAERFECIRQATIHIGRSSDHLGKLCSQLSKSLSAPSALTAWSNATPMGEVLGIQIENLCQSAKEVVDGIVREGPRPWTASDHQSNNTTVQSLSARLRLLLERIRQVGQTAEGLASLIRSTEILTTNLSIATEARSFNQVEKLTGDTRHLSHNLKDLSDSISDELGLVMQSSSEIKELLDLAASQTNEVSDHLLAWEHLRESVQHRREDLSQLISLVRPAATTLGGHIQALSSQLGECHRLLTEKREVFQGVSESSKALSLVSEQLLQILKPIETRKNSPAAVTSMLAEHQKALERSLRDLMTLASQEGIEFLSPDAQAILDQIRLSAEDAQKRILTISRSGKSPKHTIQEPEA